MDNNNNTSSNAVQSSDGINNSESINVDETADVSEIKVDHEEQDSPNYNHQLQERQEEDRATDSRPPSPQVDAVLDEDQNLNHQYIQQEVQNESTTTAPTTNASSTFPLFSDSGIFNNNAKNSNTTNSSSVILNRFSTWRQKANENAVLLLAQTQQQIQAAKEHGNSISNSSNNNSAWKWQNLKQAKLESPVNTSTTESANNSVKQGGQDNHQQMQQQQQQQQQQQNGGSYNNNSQISRSFSSEASSYVSSSSASSVSVSSSTLLSQTSSNDDDDVHSKNKKTTSSRSNSDAPPANRRVLQWATASVVDTVQSSSPLFRGRYSFQRNNNNNNSNSSIFKQNGPDLPPIISSFASDPLNILSTSTTTSSTTTTTTATTPSQTARILSTPHAQHLQQLMQGLQPHQYLMLLGRGLWGVHLKQSYGAEGGVYVDALVHKGAAAQSGIVRIGDVLVNVGNLDVSKGTLVSVPTCIAQAPRPVHLVLSTGGNANDMHYKRINYIDVSISMMHVITMKLSSTKTMNETGYFKNQSINNNSNTNEIDQNDAVKQDLENDDGDDAGDVQANKSNESVSSLEKDGTAATLELVQPTSFDHRQQQQQSQDDTKDEIDNAGGIAEHERLLSIDVQFPGHNSNSCGFLVNVRPPPTLLRKVCRNLSYQRNQDVVADFINAYNGYGGSNSSSSKMAINENLSDKSINSLQNSIQHALMLCVIDGRRFSFLSRHFSTIDNTNVSVYIGNTNDDRDGPVTASNATAMLMLLLELVNFVDYFMLTPRRKQLADKLAHKFFLPTLLGKEQTLIPPLLDFHSIVSDTSLRKLENALKQATDDEDDGANSISINIFDDFINAVVQSLTSIATPYHQQQQQQHHQNTTPFVSFLASDECARMRGYLRNIAPFVHVDLYTVLQKCPTNSNARHYTIFVLLFLLCQMDKDPNSEDNAQVNTGEQQQQQQIKAVRQEDAATGLCAALHIWHVIIPAADAVIKNDRNSNDCNEKLITAMEQFWDGFGALEQAPLSSESRKCLQELRSVLEDLGSNVDTTKNDWKEQATKQIIESKIISKVRKLANELLYDYVTNYHAKFREHRFHEWLCDELSKVEQDETNTNNDSMNKIDIPVLPTGCIKRLLRKIELPAGVSSHKPAYVSKSTPIIHDQSVEDKCTLESIGWTNAECAVVFGTPYYTDDLDQNGVQRFVSQSVVLNSCNNANGMTTALTPDKIPPQLESYTITKQSRRKPFAKLLQDRHVSVDGWEVSLVDFIIPQGAENQSDSIFESCLYGVSLVFHAEQVKSPIEYIDESKSDTVFDPMKGEKNDTYDVAMQKIKRSTATPIFDERLATSTWYDQVGRVQNNSMIGLVLLSKRNVLLSMRETLSKLLTDFSGYRNNDTTKNSKFCCRPLINFLGNYSHNDVEPQALVDVLQHYMQLSSESWIDRPIDAQRNLYVEMAGQQLVQCLPPIPLALLFVTTLLEQKIVFSSSRRSLLLSVSVALSELLKPLQWCHLIVPRVPADLAADLLQYPAPFIIGMPAEDPGMMELIRNLPNDVTLVDLDVGRVILAPSFAHNGELGRGMQFNANTAGALRSQVLFLAQSLGVAMGNAMDPLSWCCDRPIKTPYDDRSSSRNTPFSAIQSVCNTFVNELLNGTTTCCYWVQEGNGENSEPTILFDEDRFFHVKNLRECNGFQPIFGPRETSCDLALALDDFDLILEVFLRCQSMNVYISSQTRDSINFGW